MRLPTGTWSARGELGVTTDDAREMAELFKRGYRGSRCSFGYPAGANLEPGGTSRIVDYRWRP